MPYNIKTKKENARQYVLQKYNTIKHERLLLSPLIFSFSPSRLFDFFRTLNRRASSDSIKAGHKMAVDSH